MAVQTQIQARRGTAATWTSTNPTLAAGETGFETDTGKFKIGNGSTAWAALAYSAGATAVTYLFNATAGQTTFSGADANALTLAYTVGAEQVYLNGVLQVRGSDYTATNGTSIVLASGALVGDVLNVIAYSAMTITDTYTQAQADVKFVQQTNNFFAGKNKIINGDFGINQRAFTSLTATNFGFDRFNNVISGGTGTVTVTPQVFTPGTAPVAGYESTNYLRIVTTGQSATSTITRTQQSIEDVRTFAGQTATFSFWAQAASGTPSISVELGQGFGSGGSPSADVTTYAGKVTLSTSWTRYSVTVAVPSISGKTIGTTANTSKLDVRFWVSAGSDFNARTGTLGIQSNTFEFWGIQAEVGSIATPFQTATGTLAGELAACQRYYYRSTPGAAYGGYGIGYNNSSVLASAMIPLPVSMRIVPTSLEYSSNLALQTYANAFVIPSAIALSSITSQNQISLDLTVSGATAGHVGRLLNNNNTSGYIGVSAEL